MPRNRTTGIEWTEHTWNPFVGCTIHTPGCAKCYAMRQAYRLEHTLGMQTYAGTTRMANGNPVWTGKVNSASAATMRKPFTVKEPAIFFVNSMSDFFHESAKDEWRIEALGVMATTWHQYQVLTKRPEHIVPFLDSNEVALPSNVWIGATIERGDFRHRIDTLRAVPAQIRFLSVEPIIGRIGTLDLAGIHWVIGGGESGPGARDMEADWARELRDECVRQDVAFFWKQWGRPQNNPLFQDILSGGVSHAHAMEYLSRVDPVGKGGSKIDGREWKEWPAFEAQKNLF